MGKIQKRSKKKSIGLRKSSKASFELSPKRILLKDRASHFHDPKTGRFVSARVVSRSYSKTVSGHILDPAGQKVDLGTLRGIKLEIVRRVRPRGRAKARIKTVEKIAREIQKKRKPKRERKKARKKYPRIRKRKILPAEKPPKRKRRAPKNWKERITKAFEDTRDAVGVDGRIYVVTNADGSIDGELRLQVPAGIEARELIKLLSEYAEIPKGVWLAVGVAYPRDALAKTDRERYLIVANKIDVAPTYQSSQFRGEQFATALTMCDDMREAHDCLPDQIIIRVVWNGDDWRPARKGEK